MIELEKSADAYSLRDADFRLSFTHVADRWQHDILVRHNGEWRPMLTSDEGSPTDDVPPSPPLQDLRVEQVSDGVFEFQLLGQSGKGVYSAAVRFDGNSRTIDFDLCARGRSTEFPLCTASRYILAGDALLADLPQESTAIGLRAHSGQSVEIAAVPIPGSPRSECRVRKTDIGRQIDAGCFEMVASESPGKGITVRWRYQIHLGGEP